MTYLIYKSKVIQSKADEHVFEDFYPDSDDGIGSIFKKVN